MSTSTSSIESSAPRRASRPPTKVFKGHTDLVGSVAYFPDGHRIASASDDETVIIWDLKSGRQDGEPLQHDSAVRWIAISPDGRRIASGLQQGGLVIWDAPTRKVVHEIKGGGVWRLAYSPNGRWIATALMAGERVVRLWDADTGRLEVLKCGGDVLCVAFSPDGTQIAVGLSRGFFQVIEISTGKSVVGPIKGHTRRVNSIVYSPDGCLVTASQDESIRVWDSKTGVQVGKPMLGHKKDVFCISITANGRRIASAGRDKTVRVWDLETRLQVGDSFDADYWVLSVAFSPDNRYLISDNGNDVCLWDTESLAIQGSSSPPSTSSRNPPVRHRARSISSFVLDLPAVPESVVPHQDDSSSSESETSSGSSFDSILDLPVVLEAGTRRPKKKRPHNTELIHPRLQDPALEQETSKWTHNIREHRQRIHPRKSRIPADIPQGSSHPPDVQPTVPVSPEPPTDTQTQTTSTARPPVPGHPWSRTVRERWERIRSRKSHVPTDLLNSSLPIPLHERPTVLASPGRGPAADPSAIPMQGEHTGDDAHMGNPNAQKQPLMHFWNRLRRSGAPSVGSGPPGQKQPTPGVVDVAGGRDKLRLMMSPTHEQYGAPPPESQELPPIATRPPSFYEIEEGPGWSWRRELCELICCYWCFPRNTRPV